MNDAKWEFLSDVLAALVKLGIIALAFVAGYGIGWKLCNDSWEAYEAPEETIELRQTDVL